MGVDATYIAGTNNVFDQAREAGYNSALHATVFWSDASSEVSARMGRVWQPSDSSLYIAMVLRPKVPMSSLVATEQLCCLGTYNALVRLGASHIYTAYPNDLVYVEHNTEKKLGSTVAHAYASESGMFVVCAVCINIDGCKDITSALGSARPRQAASLSHCFDSLPANEEIVPVFAEEMQTATAQWEAAQTRMGKTPLPYSGVVDKLFDSCYLMGKPVDVVLPDERLVCTGDFAGFDLFGRAIVKTHDGKEISVHTEQASIRCAK